MVVVFHLYSTWEGLGEHEYLQLSRTLHYCYLHYLKLPYKAVREH